MAVGGTILQSAKTSTYMVTLLWFLQTKFAFVDTPVIPLSTSHFSCCMLDGGRSFPSVSPPNKLENEKDRPTTVENKC